MRHTSQLSSCLDLSGLHCPAPLIHCLAALHKMPAGSDMRVTVSNLDALNDIALLLRRGPHRLLAWDQDANGRCHFHIRKAVKSRPRTQHTYSWVQLFLQRLGWAKPSGLVASG